MLDQLRARVVEATEERDLWQYTIRKTGVRITCDLNIEANDYQRWLQASLPRTHRRGRAPDMSKMQQQVLSALALIGSCVKVEFAGPNGEFAELLDPTTSLPLLLDSPELLRSFGVPDAVEFVRKLFIRDADLMNAGEELLEAAGFIATDDDNADPT